MIVWYSLTTTPTIGVDTFNKPGWDQDIAIYTADILSTYYWIVPGTLNLEE